ncbi:FecR domain-containing protein [Methylobacillus flagellatus]|uniref:FecR domain-containing protein n=1 Tax=Methylobacillus flagellatus TaxID=405 RepID=UPI002853E8AC|nr:FecR domain-containing protein [Methylobacillus flagellatus]MDR5170475.1 FecR domain-containing protein [Methylobacillus flagellatus]
MNAVRNKGNSPWRSRWRPAFLAGLALAAHASAQADTVSHTVEPGDSLYKLAARYMGDPLAWPDIQKLNRISNPHRLRPGASLLIPKLSSAVTASFVHGEVLLLDNAGNPIKSISRGDQLAEGNIVRTGQNSYLSLEFADNSVARILSNTRIRLDRIKEGGVVPQGQRVIYLEQGDMDISVTPAPSRNPHHFKVITPQAVAAVRGTRFTVGAGDSSTTSVTQGQVEMQQAKPGQPKPGTVLQAGQGIAASGSGLGEVQTLLAAPDLSQLPSTLPEPELLQFSWPSLDGGREYQYRVAQDEGMEKVLWNAASDSARAALPSLQDGEYLLAVRALDIHGIAGYEAQHRFAIHSHPSSPWLLAPQQGQIVAGDSILRCTPVEGAQGYRLQIASDRDFQQIVVDADNLDHCQYQLGSLAEGRYYWRVASKTAQDSMRQGPYSQPADITISEDAGTPLAIPGQAYWTSTLQDIRYIAQVSRTPQFESLAAEQALDGPNINIQSLPPGRYYVRIATKLENQTGPFSDARIIEVEHNDDGFDRTWFDKPRP